MVLLIIGIVFLVVAIGFGISEKDWGAFVFGLILAAMVLLCSFLLSGLIGSIVYELTPFEDTVVSTETWSAVWSEEANDYIVLNTENKIMGALSEYDNITLSNEVDSIKVYCDIYVFDSMEWLNGPLSRIEGTKVRVIIPMEG